MSEYKNIKVEEINRIGYLTLTRDPLNILNIEMMDEINNALTGFKDKNICALVIQAEGKSFSAGVDVGEHEGELAKKMLSSFHNIFYNLGELEVPVISAVKGAALGGGCELAIGADIILASNKAKFGQPEIQVGVFAPVASLILPQLIGYSNTIEMLLTGKIINAEKAKEIGLVNEIFNIESFDEDLGSYLKQFSSLSSSVMKFSKKAVTLGQKDKFKAQLQKIEALYLNGLMKTKDANEGLSAFLGKRKPEWSDS